MVGTMLDVIGLHPDGTTGSCMHCRGDAIESAFYSNLIEDKTSAGTSYVDFLVAVHRSIANMSK